MHVQARSTPKREHQRAHCFDPYSSRRVHIESASVRCTQLFGAYMHRETCYVCYLGHFSRCDTSVAASAQALPVCFLMWPYRRILSVALDKHRFHERVVGHEDCCCSRLPFPIECLVRWTETPQQGLLNISHDVEEVKQILITSKLALSVR